MKERFFLGFGFILAGIDLLRKHKELRKWAAIPWVIDFILLIFGISVGRKYISRSIDAGLDWFAPAGSTLHTVLYYPLAILFWIVFVGIMIYMLYLIAGFIASPFNAVLADRALAKLGAKKEVEYSLAKVGELAVRMFLISLMRTLILLALGVFMFFLGLFPGLNFVAVFFAFLVICFDGADYSFEVLEFSLRERFEFFRRNFIEFAGMACFVGLTLIIPGLILIAMPAAVVGCSSVITRIRMRADG